MLDRRTGIPITLALVYMEVARRAGVSVEGINFPGHFLLRCRATPETRYSRDLIIDALHRRRAPDGGDVPRAAPQAHGRHRSGTHLVLAHATKPQILVRMLLNLKRVYVQMHSFPQARDITELLLAVDPSALNELRDRGLLAYHLNDFSAALRDLQTYLNLSPKSRSGRGRAQGARADLGARQDASPSRRVAELSATLTALRRSRRRDTPTR